MMEGEEPPSCPSPSPYRNPSAPFKDVSNFKTPKPPSRLSTNFHTPAGGPHFFTASKQTPRTTSSSFRRTRPSLAPPNSGRAKTAASRKLKAFELEQSQSSRKALIQKEQSLKSLSKSLSVWLNFLFQNPGSCGCNLSSAADDGDRDGGPSLPKGKKRDSEPPGSAVRVDSAWRDPKRRRDSTWRAVSAVAFSSSKYLNLRSSLEHVCSVDDLTQRMRLYLSMGSCKEVFEAMTQVAKSIDEGRLKMKAHCPLVTDFGFKEKATRILMSYNPSWLRIGLYIVFGGESLLSDKDANSDQEIRFLKMIIEKQFFMHAGLAKEYSYNKMVEGLYRPGYYEALGNVILKRFLLLVLVLDRAKCQSSLSLKYGIDGVDGGSPLLFTVQSSVKSSHQVIHDFLSSDVMLGEGSISAHLVILGYKVSYEQHLLVEFDFRVTDLFVDLQDGVRLCRAIQLLQDDTSILTKMVVPADTLKKHLANCGIALQYLRQAGVDLHDEDKMMIVADDIAGGDKELTLSLLWNMFVHLQLPLLVKKTNLAEEICKIRGNVDSLISFDSSFLEMLLKWIQAICENYDCKINSFSSLVDGKAIWCLLDYYFRKQLCCGWSSKDPNQSSHEESIMLTTDYTDAVHNFLLSQKLLTLLGNFPEVLQISDILEYNGARNDQSVVILLVFLSSQLVVKKNMDQLNFHKLLGCDCQSPERKYSCMQCFARPKAAQIQEETYDLSAEDSVRNFKAIQAWWQDMAERNHKSVSKQAAPTLDNFSFSSDEDNIDIPKVNAAKRIQSHFRRAIERRKFLKTLNAAAFLQTVVRAWLSVREKPACIKFSSIQVQDLPCANRTERLRQPEIGRRYVMFISDRHGFVNLRKSVLLIQRAVRNWIIQRHRGGSIVTHDVFASDQVNAAIVVQRYTRGWLARLKYIHEVALVRGAVKIQLAWKSFSARHSLQSQHYAATKVQSHFRGYLLRRRFHIQRQTIVKIQSVLRMSRCWKAYQQYKIASASATVIQSYVRGCVARRGADQHRRLIVVIQSQHFAATKIQSHFRGYLLRRRFHIRRQAIVKIQSVLRMSRCWKAYQQYKIASESATVIQSYVRGCVARRGADQRRHLVVVIQSQHFAATKIQSHFRGYLLRRRFHIQRQAIVRIQSVFRMSRSWKAHQQYKIAITSATVIQSYVRGCVARRGADQRRHLIVVIQSQHFAATKIQSHFRGYLLTRKFYIQRQAIVKIQSILRMSRCWKAYQQYKIASASATVIQSYVRGCVARRGADQHRHLIVVIQRYCRGWLIRSDFLCQREAAVKIQSAFRCFQCCQAFHRRRQAAVEIQRVVRGQISRNRLLGASSLRPGISSGCLLKSTGPPVYKCAEINIIFCSVVKLQRWWRGVMSLKLRTKSAAIIQSHIRRWLDRQQATREKRYIVVIQSRWRGYLARKKETGGQLLDLRLRVQKSATNVDDSMRIINRLVAALSELQTMKSVSGILHTCVTLDKATQHSQKCCERLVEAGAIKTLLKLFRSASRSIPDQEVLKHVLSTLRNLARYPHLVEVLIGSHGSVETVLWEFLRNKEEGYFIVSELLKKICTSRKGVEAMRKSPALLKRLHSLVEELSKKAKNEKRNARVTAARETTERRLREAVEILKMATES